MDLQQRLLRLVTRLNWALLFLSVLFSFVLTEPTFVMGVVFGGVIVTVNFHLLARTLKRAFEPERLGSSNVVLIKYYVRFTVSGLIIFLLIQQRVVNPLGLFVGLSVVVASIVLATAVELKKLIFKEAV